MKGDYYLKHIIIGTAGHIDHGKTTLIKALTGRETDTLKEEKDRGISINLGFTYFDLPSGRRAGIIDVPGHEKLTEEASAKDTEGHFRLPVDRVFSVSGFGSVVTGTIISGRIKVGDTVEVYPSKSVTKVRGIQIHDKPEEFGEAGQRCAINLANIKLSEISRGDVVS